MRSERSRLRALASSRPGESICTFVRELPVRELDPWVVRAVFEQLQSHLQGECRSFPLRPTDRFVEDLHVDPDDLDDDLLEQAAQRTGRLLTDLRANPYYGKVHTVEDLIRFLCEQPRQAA